MGNHAKDAGRDLLREMVLLMFTPMLIPNIAIVQTVQILEALGFHFPQAQQMQASFKVLKVIHIKQQR